MVAVRAPDLYRQAQAAGEVFQAVFRDELTAALGVEWRPGRHVPRDRRHPPGAARRFSKRSREIEAWLAATGTPDTPQGRQAAVLATRRHKPEVEHGRFDDGWKAEAEAAGWGPDAAERWSPGTATVSRHRRGRRGGSPRCVFDEHGRPDSIERIVDPEEWIADLLRTDLTATASTFTEPT